MHPKHLELEEEERCKQRRFKPPGVVILAFAFGYFFETLFVTLKTFSLFGYTTIILSFDEPQLSLGSSRQQPLVLQILDSGISNVAQAPHRFRQQNRSNLYWEDNNDFEKNDYYQPARRTEGCVPLSAWQDELHPSCLGFHEIDFLDLDFVASGTQRDTWMFEEVDGTTFALKMLRALNDKNREYDYVNTERHRKDAVAAVELSMSEYTPNIHGYCSNSAVYDYADGGGHLWTIFNRPTNDGPEIPPTKDELFKYAHDAAMGLADLHHVRTVDAGAQMKLLPH